MLELETRIPIHFPIVELEYAVLFFQRYNSIVLSCKDFHVKCPVYGVNLTDFVHNRLARWNFVQEHLTNDILIGKKIITNVQVNQVANLLKRGRNLATLW